jgi:ribonuclease Z
MARLVFLGTAAALPLPGRANTSMVVTGDDAGHGLLIDCGGDAYSNLLRRGFGPDDISDLLITHAHIDHIGSLPSLIESLRLGGRTTPLRIWALPVVVAVAQRLIAVYDFELTLDTWTFAVEFHPLEDGQRAQVAGMEARVAAMDHSVPSIGVRLELPGGALAYTCDTQPTPAIVALGGGARTLIAECTYLHDHELAARASRHLTALEAGQQAAACGVARLALVHLGGDRVIAGAAAEAAQAFAGEIIIPEDGDTLTL